MYIVQVIPLKKGIPRDSLSYFSVKSIPLGSVVEVPLQSRTIRGIVISEHPARDIKSTIRSGNFSLKSINAVIGEQNFSQEIIKTLQTIAQQTLIPLGSLITTFFPEPVFEHIMRWKPDQQKHQSIRIITLPYLKRVTTYQALIQETFLKKKSILIITPTVLEQDQLFTELKNTIPSEMRTIRMNGSLSKKKKDTIYSTILEETQQPTVFFVTPHYALIPNHEFDWCIFESINSPYYQNDFSSFIDFRSILFPLLHAFGFSFYLADNFLSPQQLMLIEKRKAFSDRTTSEKSTRDRIILLEKESHTSPLYQSPLFVSKILNILPQYLEKKQKIFIYTARKSLATITTCTDCGYVVRCPNCKSIMTLTKTNPLVTNDRIFHCNLCETEIPPMNRCPECLGWNIRPLGITTESLIEELRRFFPTAPIYQSNQNLTKTESSCKKIVNEWETTGGILIGTQKIIPFINQTDITIIASFEHIISIPHFQTTLQAIWIMQTLLEKTSAYYIIQTKQASQYFLQQFKNQNLDNLIEEENKLYELYSFPPYTTLISVTLEKITRKDHQQAKDFLKQSIKPFEHTITSNFFEFSQTYTIQATLHVNNREWLYKETIESKKLYKFLETLREHARIRIETPWMTT